MPNKGEKGTMVFEPDFVAASGDPITFIPNDKSHNAESIRDMLSTGSNLNDVLLAAAGKPVDLEAARAVKHPGFARKRFEAIFAGNPATQ